MDFDALYGFPSGNQDDSVFAANAASWLEDKVIEIGADKVAALWPNRCRVQVIVIPPTVIPVYSRNL